MGTSSRIGLRRLLLVALLAAANLSLWLIPGPVVEYIARDRPTLLGRYSVERLTGIIALAIFTLIALYIAFGARERRRGRIVRVLIALVVSLAMIGAGEWALRRHPPTPRYLIEPAYRVRAPHYRAAFPFRDQPEADRSYPRRPPGFPTEEIVLEMDARGFRNPDGIERAEIVAIGDSFVEAPHVTSEELWTTRLGKKLGVTVYNMGTSGENPGGYFHKLEHFAPELAPQTIVVMLYEGNDFRGYKRNEKPEGIRGSLLRPRSREVLVDLFGPLRADAVVPDAERVDWLPVGVPSDAGTTWYAFSPRKVGELFRTEEEIHAQRGWNQVRDGIERAARFCREQGIDLVIAYAPVKPHVILPLVRQQLDPDVLLAFTKIQRKSLPEAKRELTDGPAFLEALMANLDTEERATREVCEAAGVGFVSLTAPLREAIAEGRQAYFTYDQHWTSVGHQVVGEELWRFFQSRRP